MEVAKVFLYEYLNAHPEDHEKISEFLNKMRDTVDMTTILEEYTPPIESDPADSCRLCKKTWDSTPNAVKTTFLCGHTYHTSCNMVRNYDEGANTCIVEGCNIDEWRVVRNLRQNRTDIDVRDQLVKNLMDRADFMRDLRGFKKSISQVRVIRNAYNKFTKKSRAELIHMHIHDIRAIQNSLNIHYRGLSQSPQAKKLNSSIRVYRRFARDIFTRYHVSLRDLIDKRVIKMDWHLRSVLERHRAYKSMWRSSIRICPGVKRWKDTHEDVEPTNELVTT